MKKIIGAVIAIILFMEMTVIVSGEELKESGLYARSAVLMDAKSGRVLFEKAGAVAMPNASTTKILTCILALENADIESEITASAYAASMPKVHLGVYEGERFIMRDILYSMMLESHNDSAVMVAEAVAGSVDMFSELMNKKADEIGCENTFFITPNGLDADKDDNGVKRSHSTTAIDLARIMSYCIERSPKKDEFLEISQTRTYSFKDVERKRTFVCNNHNALLAMFDKTLAGKTGFTSKAGYCYVGAISSKERSYVVALLACGWPNNRSYKWSDSRKLLKYGMDNFYTYRFNEHDIGEQIKQIKIEIRNGRPLEIGKNAELGVVIKKEGSAEETILVNNNEKVSVSYKIFDNIKAPIDKGTAVGEIAYSVGAETCKKQYLLADRTVKVRNICDYIKLIIRKSLL